MKFVRNKFAEAEREMEALTAENKKLSAKNDQLKANLDYVAMMAKLELKEDKTDGRKITNVPKN